METVILLPKGQPRADIIGDLIRRLALLEDEKAWKITITEFRPADDEDKPE